MNLKNKNQKYLRATSVRVNDSGNDPTITAVYCPPRYKVDDKKFTEFFRALGSRFIAGGDYNDKHTFWGSRLITTKGRDLFKYTNKLEAQFISTRKPTYWPTNPSKLSNIIDFDVMNGIPSDYIEVEGLIVLMSDHISVLLSLSSNVIVKQKKISITNKKTNWELF
ncbi:Endonuclease/exonuclease/phosphatase [Cinara cedri]|uniref:Endonuclease/exonuclease/phosphatase n=1 Tax=Cinara cedri TaxID=506608 RepID=A0A5E4NME6_9HEMI|nr:Endonuclease/exonuclease/phosphatase [Cinara cedri]